MQIPVKNTPLTPLGGTGYYDIPFVYVKNYFFPKTGPDANPLIDPGTGLQAQPLLDLVPSQGDYEFRLRRHIPSWPRNFNLLDANSKQLYSPYDLNPVAQGVNVSTIRADLLVAPELVYPPGAGIRFQSNAGVQYDTAPDNYWYTQYAFQGVKRIYKAPVTTPNYPYTERPFQVNFTFALNTQYPNFQRITYKVLNYDFEMQAIYFFNDYGTNNVDPLVMGVKIYDVTQTAMMSDFLQISNLQAGNSSAKVGPAGCFPTPPVIYPRGSSIIMDVQGLKISANLPEQQYIEIVGVNRVPC